jgi:hypothetical protein
MNKSRNKTDRKKFNEWLAEREMDLMLSARADESPKGLEIIYSIGRRKIKVGDIYILNPVANWGPVYAVVLEEVSAERCLIVPFGRYATPAVPGEWSTGLRDVPLRVLCIWNSRVVDGDVLLSKRAKKISLKKVSDIYGVYRHVLSGAPVSDRLARSLGPPLIHPADPRQDYLDEERQRLNDHVAETLLTPDSNMISFNEGKEELMAWRLAAEGRPRYGKKDE